MTDSELERHTTLLRDEGYTILPPQLTAAECDEAQAALDRLALEAERGGLELIFNKEPVFEQLYRKPTLLRLVRHFLGEDALLSSMHGSVLKPGDGGGALHADGSITGHNRSSSLAADDEGARITSHVISLNTIWAISEFTDDNGATELVPGSHQIHGLELPEADSRRAVTMVAERGSVVVFNVNTWHGPTKNRTSSNRYAVLNPWRRHWTRCEYEMAAVVRPEVLGRAGEEGIVFGIDAMAPHTERWRWDRSTASSIEG